MTKLVYIYLALNSSPIYMDIDDATAAVAADNSRHRMLYKSDNSV